MSACTYCEAPERMHDICRVPSCPMRPAAPSSEKLQSDTSRAQCSAPPYPSEVSHWRERALKAEARLSEIEAQSPVSAIGPRFQNVSCSQCGRDFGPGDHGYSHCQDHAAPDKREAG